MSQGVRRVDQHMAAQAARMLQPVVTRELRTRYRQLPIMVRTAGLAATVAFLVAKSGSDPLGRAYHDVATGIRDFLIGHRYFGEHSPSNNERLLAELATMSPAGYARAAAEVELLAGWLSRLGDARWQAAQ